MIEEESRMDTVLALIAVLIIISVGMYVFTRDRESVRRRKAQKNLINRMKR